MPSQRRDKTVPKPAWGIHTVYSMWASDDSVQCGLPDGRYVRAVCEPYYIAVESFRERFAVAWWVFTGKAFAVEWPKPGDFEAIAFTAILQERARCAAIADKHRALVPNHNPDCRQEGDLVAHGYGNAALNIAHEIRFQHPRAALKATEI